MARFAVGTRKQSSRARDAKGGLAGRPRHCRLEHAPPCGAGGSRCWPPWRSSQFERQERPGFARWPSLCRQNGLKCSADGELRLSHPSAPAARRHGWMRWPRCAICGSTRSVLPKKTTASKSRRRYPAVQTAMIAMAASSGTRRRTRRSKHAPRMSAAGCGLPLQAAHFQRTAGARTTSWLAIVTASGHHTSSGCFGAFQSRT